MLNTKLRQKETYRVEGIFWDPMYKDFDFGDFEVKAYSKAQARNRAKIHPMWNMAKKPPAITKVCNTDITQLEVLIDDYINSDINR
tara:strand:- start:165 stop:422 length:258 start_codon:yes stop_codon:yes gene_type:complete